MIVVSNFINYYLYYLLSTKRKKKYLKLVASKYLLALFDAV